MRHPLRRVIGLAYVFPAPRRTRATYTTRHREQRVTTTGAGAWTRAQHCLWTLECGHVQQHKSSHPVPERAHCAACPVVPYGKNGVQR